ncbi:recombinase RecT [uncultured Acidaminococcus sp.]|uniref:recombinase RecT n=1 Tax=uncultured Acidaminococcus sp. TaxID=352152 RepID=UPI00259986FA|nr:recombinase RecT [uncultured Acidaminococcus sp.]
MTSINGGLMAKRQAQMTQAQPQAKESTAALMNMLLSKEGYQKRFDELLGKRSPQFISSIVSLMNADSALMDAFHDAPVTIIQSALQAASFDLPINPALGYAYLVPFRNSKRNRMEASFIMGYKGMLQLALRTGVYKRINVVDVRAGELKSYDRLREDIELEFIEDEDEREKAPIIGYVGYFQMINGMEKTIYMTVKQLEAHEKKFRHGNYMSRGWKENPDAMMRKTVLRKLIGKWGLMSVTYQSADLSVLRAAQAIATGTFDDEDKPEYVVDVNASEAEEAPDQERGTIDLNTPFTPEELGDK